MVRMPSCKRGVVKLPTSLSFHFRWNNPAENVSNFTFTLRTKPFPVCHMEHEANTYRLHALSVQHVNIQRDEWGNSKKGGSFSYKSFHTKEIFFLMSRCVFCGGQWCLTINPLQAVALQYAVYHQCTHTEERQRGGLHIRHHLYL